MVDSKTNSANIGSVVSVRGSVVDMKFDQHPPPQIYRIVSAWLFRWNALTSFDKSDENKPGMQKGSGGVGRNAPTVRADLAQRSSTNADMPSAYPDILPNARTSVRMTA